MTVLLYYVTNLYQRASARHFGTYRKVTQESSGEPAHMRILASLCCIHNENLFNDIDEDSDQNVGLYIRLTRQHVLLLEAFSLMR